MQAMVFERAGEPLRLADLPVPEYGAGQVLVKVSVCGVCRTDLHVVDGDLTEPKLPLVPGHEIVGRVAAVGEDVGGLMPGQRVGVPWLGGTCGRCTHCEAGRENLCDEPAFTGYQIDGGYAEYVVADARFTFPIAGDATDLHVAPWLCAGLIGYRSYRMAGGGERLGLYGFGAAAHILAQVARHQGREVFAFTRPGDLEGQQFARDLGAAWAGGSDERPPVELDAAILFAPVGALVPVALKAVRKGGRVICAGIHMSKIPAFDYRLLWEERSIHSVANLTRQDGMEFLALAPEVPVRTEVQAFPLEQANEALDRLRKGEIRGAAVLVVS